MAGHHCNDHGGCRISPVFAQPGDLQMDRSEVGSNPRPPQESLRDKLRAHYQKGMKKHQARKLTNPLTPEIINRVAVPFFLFTVFASYKIGFVDVMPLMYEGYDWVIFLQRALISVFFLEMMVNWLGIRYVDSSYTRYLSLFGPPAHEKKTGQAANTADPLAHQTHKSTNSVTSLTSAVLESPKLQPDRDDNYLGGIGSPQGVQYESFHNSGMNILTTDSSAVDYQVDLANKEMNRRNDLVNSRSIDDLLTRNHPNISGSGSFHEKSNPPSSLFFTQNDSEYEGIGNGSCKEPKDKMGIESAKSSLTSPTPVVTTQGNVITKAYPYWSWVPCYPCGRARPPRCHHCPLCKTCVLKRDHHCFFAGSCVGYRNHRFFYIFLIWAWSGCMYATLHGFPYIGFFLWPEMTYIDVFFPAAIVRFLLGYTHFQAALSVTTLTFLLYFDVLAGTFIYTHAWIISSGVTSFERVFLKNSLEIRDTRSLGQKIRSVFGPYWLLSFFLPVHFWTEPEEDPVLWPDIQVFKR